MEGREHKIEVNFFSFFKLGAGYVLARRRYFPQLMAFNGCTGQYFDIPRLIDLGGLILPVFDGSYS